MKKIEKIADDAKYDQVRNEQIGEGKTIQKIK